jgi:hypothetical protein
MDRDGIDPDNDSLQEIIIPIRGMFGLRFNWDRYRVDLPKKTIIFEVTYMHKPNPL